MEELGSMVRFYAISTTSRNSGGSDRQGCEANDRIEWLEGDVDAGIRRKDVADMATKSNLWRQMWGQRVGILGRMEILSSCRHAMSGVDKRMKMKVVIDR